MRRALVVSAILLVIGVSPAAARFEHGEATAGAGIVAGTPVAVAVRGPGGDLGSYRSRGGRSGPVWTCGYHDLTGPEGASLPGIDYSRTVDPQVGRGYAFICTDERGRQVHAETLIYDPGDPLGGLFAAERAAELAIEQLELPDPVIALNPPGAQLVGLPTWLRIEDPWEPRTTAATVSGVTSTVTATPISVTWEPGDGARLTCGGPGTAFDPGRPASTQRTDCTHTYVWPSRKRTGGAYALSATVTYDVRWRATNGAGGQLGSVTRTGTAAVVVQEAQAQIR